MLVVNLWGIFVLAWQISDRVQLLYGHGVKEEFLAIHPRVDT
jgi:hypothetical protein